MVHGQEIIFHTVTVTSKVLVLFVVGVFFNVMMNTCQNIQNTEIHVNTQCLSWNNHISTVYISSIAQYPTLLSIDKKNITTSVFF